MSHHVAAWLDHSEAHVLVVKDGSHESLTVRNQGERHQHHKAGSIGAGRTHDLAAYFDDVAAALEGAAEIYLCGPGTARQEFVKHLEAHAAGLAKRIVRVAAADRLSDGALAADARRFFKAYERTTPLAHGNER